VNRSSCAATSILAAMNRYDFMKGYVYILQCKDGSYYVGSTQDLMRRLSQHQNGTGALHTACRLPVRLVYYETYHRVDAAYKRERQLHNWSRKKKEALINGYTEQLREYAVCLNGSHCRFMILDKAMRTL
jgi:putative endonuclease